MAKQILIDIREQELSEIAHYLMIYFPYNEEMCSYTDVWMNELYENKYPLVAKGMWSGIINLKTHKLLNWKPEYGDLYLQSKICDSGTYFLLDKDKKVICRIAGYVPNGLIPDPDDCGDYIRLRINSDGTIANWPENPDFSDFIEGSEFVERIDTSITIIHSCMNNTLVTGARSAEWYKLDYILANGNELICVAEGQENWFDTSGRQKYWPYTYLENELSLGNKFNYAYTVSEELKDLAKHNFKSEEERRFIQQQRLTWISIGIATVIGILGICF